MWILHPNAHQVHFRDRVYGGELPCDGLDIGNTVSMCRRSKVIDGVVFCLTSVKIRAWHNVQQSPDRASNGLAGLLTTKGLVAVLDPLDNARERTCQIESAIGCAAQE